MQSRRYTIIHPMKGHWAGALLAAACLLAVACGGDSGGASAPSPVTTSSVSVSYPEDHGTIYLMHPLILQASDHAEDLPIHPLFQQHLAERLHQRTNPILGPIG